jgi:hypothetical protein
LRILFGSCALAPTPSVTYTVDMNLFYQALLVFAGTLIVLGYFQFRRNADIIAIVQEMARPMYLVPAVVIAICYVILRIVLGALNGVL